MKMMKTRPSLIEFLIKYQERNGLKILRLKKYQREKKQNNEKG
jgi:hypothetical protein